MNYKNFLIISLLCPILLSGQNLENNTSQNNELILSLMELSTQQLFDTANEYYYRNFYDTAYIYYNFFINNTPKNADIDLQEKFVIVYTNLANINNDLSNFRLAYDYYIKSLLICEKYNFTVFKSAIYINFGVLYYNLKQYEIAKHYYLKALDLCTDSLNMIILLNNLGANEIDNKLDSALYYLDKAIQISKRHNDFTMQDMLNNLASYYQNIKLYDSAFYYFNLSLDYSKKNNMILVEATNLSELGKLYFAVNEIDSALYYINLSNRISSENRFLDIIAKNYLTLSEIEKSKGRHEKALNHYITYTNLKDSIYNAEVFGEIGKMQRLYEISKKNEEIEVLVIDKQLKENTIRYQRIIWLITLGVLFLVTIVLAIIFLQKRSLNKAYKILVDKNIEIVELQKNTFEENKKKPRKSALTDKDQKELLDNILNVMEKPEVICNPEFTVDKLSQLVKSNNHYVSDAINDGLKMNFPSLLNSKRIKEAQRLLSDPENKKFTIEFIASRVGFNSPNVFRRAFKENTGVNPLFYIKSVVKNN